MTLKYPYSREIDEKHVYSEVIHHAVTNMIDHSASSDSDLDSDEDTSLTDTLKKNLPLTAPVMFLYITYNIMYLSFTVPQHM